MNCMFPDVVEKLKVCQKQSVFCTRSLKLRGTSCTCARRAPLEKEEAVGLRGNGRASRRQLEKGCGKCAGGGAEEVQLYKKGDRTQAVLYSSRLSCSLRPHRKPPTPSALQLASTSHTFLNSLTRSRQLHLIWEDGYVHAGNEWALQKDWSSAAPHSAQ